MELQQSARVLPSNAPALPEDAGDLLPTPTDLTETLSSGVCHNFNRGHDCSACNLPHICMRCKQQGHPATDCKFGILRVSSGNVGSSGYQSLNIDVKAGSAQKYGIRPVSSLVNPPHHSAQAAIKAEYSKRQQKILWASTKGLPMYWNVEWQTLRYRTYREKCRQKGGKNEKWPDHVEEAFQIAIRIYRKRGRTKKELNGKQCGGNEFISDFIKKTTGVERTRKQVSSHLQVLKEFLKDNKCWMSLVADIKLEKASKKAHGSSIREDVTGGHDNLEYDHAFKYQPSQASSYPFPKPPSAPVEVLASTAYPGPTIRRVLEFAMALVDEGHSQALRHTYTSIQSETASAPKPLVDVSYWRELYPPLATYYDQGQIDCPVFLFDTRLSLMDHLYPFKLTLAIKLSMYFSQGAHFTEWRSYPTFYEQNGCPVDLSRFHPDSEPWDSLDSSQVEGTDDATIGQIAFRSKWWAQVFSSLVGKKMIATNNGDPREIREEEERAIQYVQGISVMHEIWATHRGSDYAPQRMAILLWKFNTVRRGEAATTSWRRLIPPLSPYEIQSPHPPFEKPPMTLDTTLQAKSPYNPHYISEHNVSAGTSTSNLVTNPLSEDSSQSATPTPESRSFPSSTSTSFPPSVSNSTYPLFPCQESSFQSQGSAYPALDSFDSHDSGYSLYEQHESIESSHAHESYESRGFVDASQETYASQEIICHSQDALYQHGSNQQLYEYPYQIPDAPVAASASHDFTGGQIHLAYAQTEDSQSSYEAALIAPQANMVHQHQLIQHPEDFDQHDYLDQDPDHLSGGSHEVDEHGHAQSLPLPQQYEINGLAIDENTWEEMLRLNPDLERHLDIDAVDQVDYDGQQYVSSVGQETLESTQGQVTGEVEDENGTPDRQLEYQ